MAITPSQSRHPIWEQHEVLQTLLMPLLGENFLPLRATCRLLKGACEDNYHKLRFQIFTERNGALAPCEKDIALEDQIEKIKRVSALNKQLKNTSDPWLIFAQEGIPQIVNYKDHFPRNVSSALELLKAKYQFYRCGSVKDRDDQLQRLFDFQDKVILDFDQRRVDPMHPLQDLRDRYRRLQKLNKERALLQSAVKASHGSFFKSLSLIEKVLIVVISFFHSLFQKPSSEMKITSLAFKKFRENEIQLAETTIVFNGQEHPYRITAQLNYANGKLADAVKVCIKSEPDNNASISFEIRREWRIENNHYFSEDDFDSKKTIGQLRDRRLHILVFPDQIGQDPITGDKPFLRLITQIAVEIFEREPETKLVMTCCQGNSDVFVAGGFTIPSRPPLREISYLNDPFRPFAPLPIAYKKEIYLQWIQNARRQGRLFPPRREIGSFDVQLEKSSDPLETQFVTTDDQNRKQPAYVDFVLNAVPITWEEQREHHWHLPPSKNPLLPKPFSRNLDRFEQSLPAIEVSHEA